MNSVDIRKVTEKDIFLLQQISRQTFSETFSEVNREENMKKYLDDEFSTQKLKAELSNPDSAFYFAVNEDAVIGYLKLNFGPSQTELQDDKAIEIERIYVLKEFQGKKAGQALFEKAMQIARQNGAEYVWLGVWEENKKAISFYTKNGFTEFDKHIFKLGNEEQTDIMMKLQLIH